MSAKAEPVVAKEIDIPTLITVSTSILALPGTIYGIYDLWKRLGGKKKGHWMKVKTIERHYNFNDNTVDEIVKQIELDMKK